MRFLKGERKHLIRIQLYFRQIRTLWKVTYIFCSSFCQHFKSHVVHTGPRTVLLRKNQFRWCIFRSKRPSFPCRRGIFKNAWRSDVAPSSLSKTSKNYSKSSVTAIADCTTTNKTFSRNLLKVLWGGGNFFLSFVYVFESQHRMALQKNVDAHPISLRESFKKNYFVAMQV